MLASIEQQIVLTWKFKRKYSTQEFTMMALGLQDWKEFTLYKEGHCQRVKKNSVHCYGKANTCLTSNSTQICYKVCYTLSF